MNASHPAAASLLTQRLLALFIAGWALFDFPLLGLGLGTGPDATLFGLPRLPVLLFAGWGGLIVGLAWLMERREGGADGRRGAMGSDGADRPDRAGAADAGDAQR